MKPSPALAAQAPADKPGTHDDQSFSLHRSARAIPSLLAGLFLALPFSIAHAIDASADPEAMGTGYTIAVVLLGLVVCIAPMIWMWRSDLKKTQAKERKAGASAPSQARPQR